MDPQPFIHLGLHIQVDAVALTLGHGGAGPVVQPEHAQKKHDAGGNDPEERGGKRRRAKGWHGDGILDSGGARQGGHGKREGA